MQLHQLRQVFRTALHHVDRTVATPRPRPAIFRHEPERRLGMQRRKGLHRRGIEPRRPPLALDRDGGPAPSGPDEVDLVLLLVAPVVNLLRPRLEQELVEHHVLEKRSLVIGSERVDRLRSGARVAVSAN